MKIITLFNLNAMEALEKIDDTCTKAAHVLSEVLYAEDFEDE